MEKKAFSPTIRVLLIWLLAHVFAIVTYVILIFSETSPARDGISIDSLSFFFIVITLGAIFSTPAIFLLVPLVSWIVEIESRLQRLAYGFFGILILCGVVILIFYIACNALLGRSVPSIAELAHFLLPYVMGAELAFVLMLWNVDISKSPRHNPKNV